MNTQPQATGQGATVCDAVHDVLRQVGLPSENINEIGYANPYSNTVAMIQSSGTGKSRTVHEMANLVFTLPFNIRFPKESTSMIA